MTYPNETAHSSNSHCAKRKASSSASNNVPDSKAQKRNDGERATPSFSGNVRIVESWIPSKAKNDPNEYKIIKLSNGLRACLICRKKPIAGSPHSLRGSGLSSTLPIQLDNDHENFPSSHGYLHSQMPSLACRDYDYPGCKRKCGTALAKSESTSIAMTVNVGGLDDPEDAQGLAHFTEHVVHCGSEEFPDEDEISEHVWNFGEGNAFTTKSTTTYHNIVPDSVIERNMELFSGMLTNPSLKVDMIQREVHAIDDEFYLRQASHFPFRKQFLHAHVAYAPIHPLARMWCGKLETLGKGTLSGSKHVQDRMKQSHANNYVASAMAFAINSTKSIPELEELTLKHFSKLQVGKRQVRHETNKGDWSRHQLWLAKEGRHIFMQGISSKAELSLIWHLPASIYICDDNDKTMDVIRLLLAESSETGLIAHLKAKELVYATCTGHECTPYAILLQIDFKLTEKGRIRESTAYIRKATEEYVKMLQGINEEEISRYFNQIKLCQLRSFEYGSQSDPVGNTVECAMMLQNVVNPQDILTSVSWKNATFNYGKIQNALKRMNGVPGVTVIETLPKQSSLEEKLEEMHFHPEPRIAEAPYTKARYFEVAREPVKIGATFFGVFGFPQMRTNLYLERDVTLLRSKVNHCGGAGDMPQQPIWKLIPPENHGNISQQKLSYRSQVDHPGTTEIPKISGIHLGHGETDSYISRVNVYFVTPSQRLASTRGVALSWLWALCIRQSLSTFATEFALAGYRFSMKLSGALEISIRGFPKFMEAVSKTILSKVFDCPITETTFNLAKEEMKNMWEIHLGASGALLTRQIIFKLLFAQNELTLDTLGILEDLTLNDLRCLIEANRISTYAFIKLKGNVPTSLFHSLAATLDRMDFAPFMENNSYNLKYLVPCPNLYCPGETCVRMKNRANCTFTNSVTNLYILGRNFGNGHHQSACFEAAMKFINQEAFSFLRTRQQLAYTVNAGSVNLEGLRDPILMLKVTIVATAGKHSPCELDQKIDEFLSEYGDYLSNMSDNVYNKMAELRGFTVTKKEVAEWFITKFGSSFSHSDRHLKCLRKGIRKVSIQEIGCGNSIAEAKRCDCEVCGGIQEWVKGGNHESYLEFAVGDRQHSDYFVRV